MGIVRENIEFKRGANSKQALGVGSYVKIYPPFKYDDIPKGIYVAEANDEGYICLLEFGKRKALYRLSEWVYHNMDPMDPYYGLGQPEKIRKTEMYSYDWWLKNENIISLQKIDLTREEWDQKINNFELDESINFERTKNSKKSLDIGIYNNPPFTDKDVKEFKPGFYKIISGPQSTYFFIETNKILMLSPWYHENSYFDWFKEPVEISYYTEGLNSWLDLSNIDKFIPLDGDPRLDTENNPAGFNF